ncbi:alpha-amylase [Vibrio sp. qd031]|uniref:alpha-amylase family protein n=1 Tax=Vibrio sp. qd031 TaxID=1603038 RepID=UPI000A11F2A9|nr:alpha-amylase family protein [Vibrio sp. qd031]ORT48537.1 alpha-amylase [Vibrio sp. qd031]
MGHLTHQSEPKDVILHAFDWPYQLITERAEQIHLLGYKTVLISPPMKSFVHESGTKWWQRYQPQDYRVIENQLGNTLDFKKMVKTLEQHGLRVYVDVVFNHMANEAYQRQDLQYPSVQEMAAYQKDAKYYESLKLFGDLSEPLFTEEHFVEAFGIKDWQNTWEVQNGRITGGEHDPGLPTLKVCDRVVQVQQDYIKALKALGVKGFRIDAAKHLSIEHIKQVWTEEISEGVHIFGEIITDGGATRKEYALFLKPYLEETLLAAYDFPLFSTLYRSLQADGVLSDLVDPFTFGEALSRKRAITFAITHDIPNNDVFMPLIMTEELEWLAYCYVLCRDGGVPLIYTDLNTSGIKGSNGEPRWQNAWCDPRIQPMIAFHNLVHGKKMGVSEVSDDHFVCRRGDKGIVAINKSQQAKTVRLRWSKAMKNMVDGQWVHQDATHIQFEIPARGYVMLIDEL